MYATHGIAKKKPFCLSNCLSVRLSVKRVDCDKTKGTCAHILIPHETSFILVYYTKRELFINLLYRIFNLANWL